MSPLTVAWVESGPNKDSKHIVHSPSTHTPLAPLASTSGIVLASRNPLFDYNFFAFIKYESKHGFQHFPQDKHVELGSKTGRPHCH